MEVRGINVQHENNVRCCDDNDCNFRSKEVRATGVIVYFGSLRSLFDVLHKKGIVGRGRYRSFAMAWELIMIDMERELELLERCALECSLIAALATDRRARNENEALASEYREIAEALRSYRRAA